MSRKQHPGMDTVEILIVEDSPAQAEALCYVLEQGGYRVTYAPDGAKALDLLDDHQPAIVISDIVMPEMNGYQLCQHLKADRKFRDIPVILLTALTDKDDLAEGLVSGADSFISKPINGEYLLGRIEATLAGILARSNRNAQVEFEIDIAGRSHMIVTDPKRLISMLLSTFEAAIHRNRELIRTQEELSLLNDHLEDLVEERTAALAAELIERNFLENQLRRPIAPR